MSTLISSIFHSSIQNPNLKKNNTWTRCHRNKFSPENVHKLWAEFLEKEKELNVYKERLKELEIAFNYNLELISERDLELSFLESQLSTENERFKQVLLEKNELDDFIKSFDDKSHRKIQQLEMKLSVKDEEIRELQRETTNSVTSLKEILEDSKQHHQKQIFQLSAKFEMQKNDIIKRCREEMEDKEKYYVVEIHNLSEQMQEIVRENEMLIKLKDENKSLKHHLEEIKKLFQEKENCYLEELKLRNNTIHIDKEIQCGVKMQVNDEKIQVGPIMSGVESQTTENPDPDDYYKKKISFLQEQNEVLKWIVKDLKKNREESKTENEEQRSECAECKAVKAEMEEVNRKFESEIENLKKVFYDEQKQRAEEESAIKSLESSVTSLKNKLLLGLQEKLEDYAGDDICSYTYNRELQNEIKISLLEQKVDSFISITEDEKQKQEKKLQLFKNEILEKIEKFQNDQQEPKAENLLEKIRLEIQKLENKIESDMKNLVRNNIDTDKCDKNLQTGTEVHEKKEFFDTALAYQTFPQVTAKSDCFYEQDKPRKPLKINCKNNISPEKYIRAVKMSRENVKFQNMLERKKLEGKALENNFFAGRCP